ncbi:MAG: leucine-rich repeat domain-containing protein [Clostridia bacterium]|nr:leucine-rich repeat domain-containing protein [Clostridia bacterium]
MMKKAFIGAIIIPAMFAVQLSAFASYMTYAVRGNDAALVKAEMPDSSIDVAEEFRGIKITGLGVDLFRGNDALESVDLPETISYIEWGAFEDCKNLLEIALPDKITMIEDMTFNCCATLKKATLPKELKSIGVKAFAGTALSEVVIPEGTEAIDIAAFENCAMLKRVVIPESVIYIGEDAFSGCNLLTVECKKGSAAEEYLRTNGVPYVVI